MKDLFIGRKYIIIALIAIASLTLTIKLFRIQLVDDTYMMSAESNVLRRVTQYPARGLIYDRKGKLIVFNQAAYDLMVIPAQVLEHDTASLCNILGITRESYSDRMKAAISYSRRAPSVFLKQISAENYARLQEKLFIFPGFYVQTRTLRKYSRPVASHILGYVSEVDEGIIKRDSYYKSGDYIGTTGIEEAYEKELRGKKGVTLFLVDVLSRIKGSYADGRLDTVAVQGKDIVSTIDLDLQEYAEHLMQNKSGSIVAIEPSTGEVLTLVSAPDYDPSLLVGRVRSDNFRMLQNDTLNPLFNRAIMASYPPGSTFKPMIGLIGLQEGVLSRNYEFFCSGGYFAPGVHVACHHFQFFNLPDAISTSCNSYFCNAFRMIIENGKYDSTEEAYNKWRSYLAAFGFGSKLGIELNNELTGFVPESGYYDNIYRKGHWSALTVLSLAIGQGELGTTPLQMANMVSTIANKGYYITPHLVKAVGSDSTGFNPGLLERHETGIDTSYFNIITDGMKGAVGDVPGATASWVAIRDIKIAGKTGTAQNPHGPDHSIFVAFAPADNPKIAISVYVENAGFGSTFAAPVASLIIEKYLKGKIENKYLEDFVLNPNSLNQ